MKKILLLMLGLAALVGCKTSHEDNPHINVKMASAPQVTPSLQNVITLNKYAPKSTVNFQWKPADYGYAAAVKYAVQLAGADGNFSEPVELGVVSATEYQITTEDLNNAIVNRLSMDADTLLPITFRVGSFISEKIDRIYSEPATYYVRAYTDKIVYPSLAIAGTFGDGDLGWNPGNPLLRVWSMNFDKNYEGWIYMSPGAGNGMEYKIVDGFEWGKDKGGPAVTVDPTSGAVTGTIEGGDNIKGTPSGFYRMNVVWNPDGVGSFTLTPFKTMGIIGSGIGGWGDNDDVVFAYNFTTRVWEVTATFVDGEIKFRADHSWGTNWGKNSNPNEMAAGGDNIPVTAGKYNVTLNMTQAVLTYSIVPAE